MLYVRLGVCLLVALLGATTLFLHAQPQQQQQQRQQQQQQQQQELPASRVYILFIHTGGGPKDAEDKLVPSILIALVKAGYSVRKPDTQRDVVGGPGVDYFDDDDARKAQEVAEIVNATLLPKNLPRLEARRQRVKNPPGYLGVWLF